MPEQRSCISTYAPSKASARDARFVLMHRMKCGAHATRSSCSLAICSMYADETVAFLPRPPPPPPPPPPRPKPAPGRPAERAALGVSAAGALPLDVALTSGWVERERASSQSTVNASVFLSMKPATE